jgi:hypothetical protein
VFYPQYAAEIVKKACRYGEMIYRAYSIYHRVESDPAKSTYTDLAISPVQEKELDTLAMFTETSGGEAAVVKKRWADDLRARVVKLEAAE